MFKKNPLKICVTIPQLCNRNRTLNKVELPTPNSLEMGFGLLTESSSNCFSKNEKYPRSKSKFYWSSRDLRFVEMPTATVLS